MAGSKLTHPPINQEFLHEKQDPLAHHWKRWFVDLHQLVEDQQAKIEALEQAAKTNPPNQ